MTLIEFATAAAGVLGLLTNPDEGVYPWAFGAIMLGVAVMVLDRWLDSKDMP
jgi:hypothetical protein